MKIIPFKGILYNTDKVNLGDVVTLPYDKITPEQKSIYESGNPYNMVHLVLPKTHSDAASLFRQWLKEGVLREDREPAIYVYEQKFEYPEGVIKNRKGIIALLEVKPFGKDTIMPHEKTFSNIVDERMQLLDKCKANLEQIFVLYKGRDISGLLSGTPRIDFRDEFGLIHRLWDITDSEKIKFIQESINNAQLFIADGHHRYTASLLYKERMNGDDYIMATFVDSNAPGLVILPTHRVLKDVPGLRDEWLLERLGEYFVVEKRRQGLTLFSGDNYYSLKLKDDILLEKVLGLSRPRAWLYLDVNILHLLILRHIMKAPEGENIIYLREEAEAVSMVKNKKARLAFILNPTSIEDVKKIVSLNEVMPHKSTDFYPKLHSGLVMRRL